MGYSTSRAFRLSGPSPLRVRRVKNNIMTGHYESCMVYIDLKVAEVSRGHGVREGVTAQMNSGDSCSTRRRGETEETRRT
jgi:hypothetical protein